MPVPSASARAIDRVIDSNRDSGRDGESPISGAEGASSMLLRPWAHGKSSQIVSPPPHVCKLKCSEFHGDQTCKISSPPSPSGPLAVCWFPRVTRHPDSSSPREAKWKTEAGGWVNSYIGDGQAANWSCTTHTHAMEHGSEPRSRLAGHGAVAFVLLGCRSNPRGGRLRGS